MRNKQHDSNDRGTALIAVLALLFSLLLHALLFVLTEFDLVNFRSPPDKVYVYFEPEKPKTEAVPAPLVGATTASEPEMLESLQDASEEIAPSSESKTPPEAGGEESLSFAELPMESAPVDAQDSSEPHQSDLTDFPDQGLASDGLLDSAMLEEIVSEEVLDDTINDFSSQNEYLSTSAYRDDGVTPYRLVESEFDILRGVDGYKIGQSKMRYELNDDGSYLLESMSEAKGIASLFVSGSLLQRSEGVVTEQGLQPRSFLYQYGSRNKTRRADFDWKSGSLVIETDGDSRSVNLPVGAQDLMSFMYQFMYIPPLQEMSLNITNGKRLKVYHYSFVGEEDLSTRMGSMRAIHIENINDDGDEKAELWLALEYNFLPVKIRKTEDDGSVIEQVITQIYTELLQ